ncbi:hypothetical protein VTK56DRAFT_8253 [Thermocarpiscus australiensis]
MPRSAIAKVACAWPSSYTSRGWWTCWFLGDRVTGLPQSRRWTCSTRLYPEWSKGRTAREVKPRVVQKQLLRSAPPLTPTTREPPSQKLKFPALAWSWPRPSVRTTCVHSWAWWNRSKFNGVFEARLWKGRRLSSIQEPEDRSWCWHVQGHEGFTTFTVSTVCIGAHIS